MASCWAAPSHAEDDDNSPPIIKKIEIKGNLRTETMAILNQIQSRPKKPLDRSKVADDVKRIFALGPFKDVQVSARRDGEQLVLIFRVKEKPAIRDVRFKGYKEVGIDDIKKVVDVKKYGILNRARVQQNVQKIRELYVEKGFYLAEVEAEISRPTNASVIITFQIRENAKIMIRQINFVGNQKVTSQTLRQYLQTSEQSLLGMISGRSTYQEALIQQDLFRLNSYYMDHGYIKVKMGKPKVYLNADKRSIYITYWVTEGESYRYRKVGVKGDLLMPAETMLKKLTLRKGNVFNRTQLYKENLLALTNYYQNRGYAYVNVIPRHNLIEETREIDLTLEIQKGKKVRIERIEISGNTITQDRVVRREIRVAEGDYYNGRLVQISQQRIFALGFFEKAHPLYGIKANFRKGSQPDRVILQFEVKEKPTGTFQIGAGFSSFEQLVFNAQIAKNNLFGRGQSLSFAAQLSSIRQLFQIQFIEPYLFDSRWTFAFSAYNSQRDYGTLFSIGFRQTTTGGSLTWGYPLLDDLNLLLTYKFERVQINASGNTLDSGIRIKGFFSGVDGPSMTSSLRLTLRYDKRDNRLFPTKGHFQSLSVEHADWYLGSQNRFTRISAISRWYIGLPFFGNEFLPVLRFNLQLGWIFSPSAQGVPSFERYRLGGINSIRGFRPFTIGPTRRIPGQSDSAFKLDEFNWGGNKELIFNAELEIPIIPSVGLKGVLFFDAGNTYDDNEFLFEDRRNPFLPLGLFMSAGFGFRWFSPIGPLRFEFGLPITKRPGDETILFEFNIGNSF
ncbi:MAG: outer membrane protein assembly factor BamA [Myxococcales bacterium]|nr:outer membrane protein assembly factor BamA [Myxococcales bacterium]